MNFTRETKVGLFALIALFSLFTLYMWLNGSSLLNRGSQVEAAFSRVDDLRPGASVKYAGVDIGRVSRVYFEKDKVIVMMLITQGITLPTNVKAMISSAGVVGDKYVALLPAQIGQFKTLPKNRIPGETPVSMEQFYSTTNEVLNSLKAVADSIKNLMNDPNITGSLQNTLTKFDQITTNIEIVTRQFSQINFQKTMERIDHTLEIVERLATNNEPAINSLIGSITKASAEITQATITVNKFLNTVDNNGQTAANLQQTLVQIQQISANLEKFTTILAANGSNIEQLSTDAHQTMQSINQAATTINSSLQKFTDGDGINDAKNLLVEAGAAANKVGKYVGMFEQVALKNSVGASLNQNGLAVDYQMELNLNPQNGLRLGMEDIGGNNLATMQWAYSLTNYTYRAGLYKNQFGIGFNHPVTPNFNWGIDLWDTHTPKAGISSNWQLNSNWSFSLGAATTLNTNSNNAPTELELECWRNF